MIYGPPAVGKLTVAKEIARLTGLKLFDNHLTVNVVQPIFGWNSEAYFRTLRAVRLTVIAEAARQGIDLVGTMVYLHPGSLPYIEQLEELLASLGAELCLLRLMAERAVLDKRVVDEDRAAYHKIATTEGLDRYLSSGAVGHAIPSRDSLTIDNTDLTPTDVAMRAISHYGLESTGPTATA
jgi:hypothetical protein